MGDGPDMLIRDHLAGNLVEVEELDTGGVHRMSSTMWLRRLSEYRATVMDQASYDEMQAQERHAADARRAAEARPARLSDAAEPQKGLLSRLWNELRSS